MSTDNILNPIQDFLHETSTTYSNNFTQRITPTLVHTEYRKSSYLILNSSGGRVKLRFSIYVRPSKFCQNITS